MKCAIDGCDREASALVPRRGSMASYSNMSLAPHRSAPSTSATAIESSGRLAATSLLFG